MKDTDTGILSSEANECSNFPGTKPELNQHFLTRSSGLALHLFRLLSCCHLPPLGSTWGLIGNNLECYNQGPRLPLGRSFPLDRRIPGTSCWSVGQAAFAFAGCAFCRSGWARSWICLPVLCPRQGESTLCGQSIQKCSLHFAIANQKHSADPDIVL